MIQLVDERKANRARAKVARLISNGNLSRSDICEQCGKDGYNVPHHDDYDKPLNVVWLCLSCHGKLECSTHKPKKKGYCNDGRGNRPKTDRNNKIWEYYVKGYRYQSIANIFKMKVSTVSMVILRKKQRE